MNILNLISTISDCINIPVSSPFDATSALNILVETIDDGNIFMYPDEEVASKRKLEAAGRLSPPEATRRLHGFQSPHKTSYPSGQ